MLGLSDLFDEDSGVTLEMVIRELEGATGLEVLRINRNMGLVLSARGESWDESRWSVMSRVFEAWNQGLGAWDKEECCRYKRSGVLAHACRAR